MIQREDSLESLIRPGISIGAELTHSLLESIFFPGNPPNDGAVIVSLNQIVSAANVLPLSDRFTGDQKLGTRHRAALGLTERSDALVLVVSDETGKVSFAETCIQLRLMSLNRNYTIKVLIIYYGYLRE